MEKIPNYSNKEKLIVGEASNSSSNSEEENDIIKEKSKNNIDQFHNSSYCNRMFFNWNYKVLQKSKEKLLEIPDLGILNKNHNSEDLLSKLNYIWDNENYKAKEKNPLFNAIIRLNKNSFIVIIIFSIFSILFDFSATMLFREMIRVFGTTNNKEQSDYDNNPSNYTNYYQYNDIRIMNDLDFYNHSNFTSLSDFSIYSEDNSINPTTIKHINTSITFDYDNESSIIFNNEHSYNNYTNINNRNLSALNYQPQIDILNYNATIIQIRQPLILSSPSPLQKSNYIQEEKNDITSLFFEKPYVLGILFFLSKSISILIVRHIQFREEKQGTKSAIVLRAFLFQKLLKISNSSNHYKFFHGEIVNFMLIDSKKLSDFMNRFHYMIVTPILLIANYIYLFNILGISFIVGVVCNLIGMTISFFISKKYRSISAEILKTKDDRISITNEALSYLKVIKLYGWDNQMLDRVLEKRNVELSRVRSLFNLLIFSITFNTFLPMLISFAVIGSRIYLIGNVVAEDIFTVIYIFSTLQGPMSLMSFAGAAMLELLVSFVRIEKFIFMKDVDKEVIVNSEDIKEECVCDKNESDCVCFDDDNNNDNNGNNDFKKEGHSGYHVFGDIGNAIKDKVDNTNNSLSNSYYNLRSSNYLSNKRNSNQDDLAKNNNINNSNDRNNSINTKVLNINNLSSSKVSHNSKSTCNPFKNEEDIAIHIPNLNFSWGIYKEKTSEATNATKIKEMNTNNINNNNRRTSLNSISTISKDLNDDSHKSNNYKADEYYITEDDLVLKNIDFKVRKGEFICIIGGLGSGKTSLLCAILNEMKIITQDELDAHNTNSSSSNIQDNNSSKNSNNTNLKKINKYKKRNTRISDNKNNLYNNSSDYSDKNNNSNILINENDQSIINSKNPCKIKDLKNKILINGSTSYISQISFIENTTLKKNIIFNSKYNPRKYNKIISLCELTREVNSFIGKDLIEIGEKGVNLSGGQKTRINLARAMYSNKDIYLFDDPLSMLDLQIGNNILENCILSHLKDKTRILVTHNINHIKQADRIFVLDNGAFTWEGRYEELVTQSFFENLNYQLKFDRKNSSFGYYGGLHTFNTIGNNVKGYFGKRVNSKSVYNKHVTNMNKLGNIRNTVQAESMNKGRKNSNTLDFDDTSNNRFNSIAVVDKNTNNANANSDIFDLNKQSIQENRRNSNRTINSNGSNGSNSNNSFKKHSSKKSITSNSKDKRKISNLSSYSNNTNNKINGDSYFEDNNENLKNDEQSNRDNSSGKDLIDNYDEKIYNRNNCYRRSIKLDDNNNNNRNVAIIEESDEDSIIDENNTNSNNNKDNEKLKQQNNSTNNNADIKDNALLPDFQSHIHHPNLILSKNQKLVSIESSQKQLQDLKNNLNNNKISSKIKNSNNLHNNTNDLTNSNININTSNLNPQLIIPHFTNIDISNSLKIRKIITEEDRNKGKLSFHIYTSYLKLIGSKTSWIILIIASLLFEITKQGTNFYIRLWQNNKTEISMSTGYLIYVGIGTLLLIFTPIKQAIAFRGSINLSSKLHLNMITSIIKAPINLFHDRTPKGRLLNRLSKDLDELDKTTIFAFTTFFFSFISLFFSILVSAYFFIYFLIFIPMFILSGIWLLKTYIEGSREFTRLEGIARSPITSVITETLSGLTTIRAYHFERVYLKRFLKLLDDFYLVNVFISGGKSWFGLFSAFISLLFLAFQVTVIVLMRGNFDKGSIALLLNAGLILQNSLFDFMFQLCQMELSLISLERCMTFTEIQKEIGYKEDYIPKEERLLREKNNIKEDSSIPDLSNWPQKGSIKFTNYTVRYRPDTEIILNNLNLTIPAAMKLGIVGRTGSGKSTLCLALFRIIDPTEGTIFIDNVDILNIDLIKLRKCLTIIPQDPTLVQGSLRYNIDPLNEFNDEDIIKIIKEVSFDVLLFGTEDKMVSNNKLVRMKSMSNSSVVDINNNNSNIDNDISDDLMILQIMVDEGGSNFSVGERQMICIIRALLRKTKIIVMDEATASIDEKTERLIQKAMDKMFKYCTVITIAHRIKTILNYDKILVLSDGKIIEYDTPINLVNNKESEFYSYYNQHHLKQN